MSQKFKNGDKVIQYGTGSIGVIKGLYFKNHSVESYRIEFFHGDGRPVTLVESSDKLELLEAAPLAPVAYTAKFKVGDHVRGVWQDSLIGIVTKVPIGKEDLYYGVSYTKDNIDNCLFIEDELVLVRETDSLKEPGDLTSKLKVSNTKITI